MWEKNGASSDYPFERESKGGKSNLLPGERCPGFVLALHQTKSRDMWQVVCSGGRLGLDEYCILKINKLCTYVCCNYA